MGSSFWYNGMTLAIFIFSGKLPFNITKFNTYVSGHKISEITTCDGIHFVFASLITSSGVTRANTIVFTRRLVR